MQHLVTSTLFPCCQPRQEMLEEGQLDLTQVCHGNFRKDFKKVDIFS